MDAEIIGLFLRDLRKHKGLKQKDVAEEIQVSDKTISKWETGRGIPDVEALQSLSDFYEVSINEILAGKHISEEEIIEIADQNIKTIVQERTGLKRKLRIAIIGVIALLILIGIILLFMSTSETANVVIMRRFDYSTSDMDVFFRDVTELEAADIKYSILLDTENKIITIGVNVYEYDGKIEDFEWNSREIQELPLQ